MRRDGSGPFYHLAFLTECDGKLKDVELLIEHGTYYTPRSFFPWVYIIEIFCNQVEKIKSFKLGLSRPFYHLAFLTERDGKLKHVKKKAPFEYRVCHINNFLSINFRMSLLLNARLEMVVCGLNLKL